MGKFQVKADITIDGPRARNKRDVLVALQSAMTFYAENIGDEAGTFLNISPTEIVEA